jgi:hypothetical protein
VKAAWADPLSRPTSNKRATERISVMLPARLTWKDERGTTRFASVITRDVSEFGVFVECPSPISITQFRLVQFQLEKGVGELTGVPDSLRQGRLLAAVYRVNRPTKGGARQGLALRLMVDPRRRLQSDDAPLETATSDVPLELVAATQALADDSRATV